MNKSKLLDRIHVELGADIAAEVSVMLIDHAVVPNETLDNFVAISRESLKCNNRLAGPDDVPVYGVNSNVITVSDCKALIKALEEK